MVKSELFRLNNAENVAICVYLGKLKKPYNSFYFSILVKRGILEADGRITTVGKMILKNKATGGNYDRRPVPKRKSATKKKRKKKK